MFAEMPPVSGLTLFNKTSSPYINFVSSGLCSAADSKGVVVTHMAHSHPKFTWNILASLVAEDTTTELPVECQLSFADTKLRAAPNVYDFLYRSLVDTSRMSHMTLTLVEIRKHNSVHIVPTKTNPSPVTFARTSDASRVLTHKNTGLDGTQVYNKIQIETDASHIKVVASSSTTNNVSDLVEYIGTPSHSPNQTFNGTFQSLPPDNRGTTHPLKISIFKNIIC